MTAACLTHSCLQSHMWDAVKILNLTIYFGHKWVNAAFDIAILKVTFNVNWEPLILSAVDRLEKLISTQRRDPELNPGSLR